MCGHVGVAGNLVAKEETAFKQLLVIDQLRGVHSTGVASIGRDTGNVTVFKQVGDPQNLFEDKRFDRLMQGNHRVLMGHNRWATAGKINRTNAHPFEFETLVGAHNGTLSSRHKLLDNNQFDVDSEAFFNHVNERGIADAVKQIQGAWCFIWWDKLNDTINFLRNAERPLYFVITENDKQLFWASEDWMLEGILGRNGIKYDKVMSLVQDKHVSFKIDAKTGAIGKPHVKDMPAEKQHYTYPNSGLGTHGQQNSTTSRGNNYPVTKPLPGAHVKQVSNVVDMHANAAKIIEESMAKVTPLPNMPAGILGNRDEVFDVLAIGMDGDGNRYYDLESSSYKQANFRAYIPKKLEGKLKLGDVVQGDVGGWFAKDGGYFKLSLDQIEVLVIEADLLDHRGDKISVEDFEKQYAYCAWCNGDIRAGDENMLLGNGDCICPTCQMDDQVKPYLKTEALA